MANFTPKSFPQIVATMAAKVSSETPISDFSDGSVILTLLEAAAQEDFQQYIQMLNIIRNYNLDTTEGADLDLRAAEYGITRFAASPHSGFVTITDTSFTKIFTKVYAGLPGPTQGSSIINVDDASAFPASGVIYIGRGTANSEGPIAYSAAPVDNTSYWTITLDTALVNDHGTDESVILGQSGIRTIEAGTEVEIPETDVSAKVLFELNQTINLLDGEDTFTSVLVTAVQPGGFKVPANSISSFPNDPFAGAQVTNPLPFVNGRDIESDQSLRDRIRATIQSLSRGTSQSISNGIIGLIDQNTNNSIVSVNIIPPVTLADGPTLVYIDNGRGLEPEVSIVGLEELVGNANGGEKFFQLQNFPVTKSLIVSQTVEPFGLVGGETFIIRVGTDEEIFTFAASDFNIPGRADGSEVAAAINHKSLLVEARTILGSLGRHLMVTPRASVNETMQLNDASTAQNALNFSTLEVQTLRLYKNDKLLTKDGITASVLSQAQPFNLSTLVTTTTDGDITVTPNSAIITKLVAGSFPFLEYIHAGDYVKFSTDADSFYLRVRTVVSNTKIILEAPYSATGGGVGDLTIWSSPQLEVAGNGDNDQAETIFFGPNDFTNPLQVLANEIFVRIQLELQSIRSELAVNDTKLKLVSEIEDSSDSSVQVLGGGAAIALGFCSTTPVTGTFTFTSGSTLVTGVGTSFTTELQKDQWIKADTDGISGWSQVQTIEDDTTLYLWEGYRGFSSVGGTATKTNFGILAVGQNKDYTLNRSNGQIELATPLLATDKLTAGSLNVRAFLDSVPETFNFSSLGPTSTLIVSIDGGEVASVTTGDGSAPYDTFSATSLIGFHANIFNGFYIEWLTGANVGQTSFVSSYNNTTGQIVATTPFTDPILVGDKFVLSQVLTFTNATDFATPATASAAEVVAAINKQLLGGKAEELTNGRVRIRTANFSEGGEIQIKGGTASTILLFSTELAMNQSNTVAFVRSQNSDRDGNTAAKGFTLGPNQNLAVIFDADSLNKTFSVNLQVSGTVTTPGSGTFSDSALGVKYTDDDFFLDFWVYWLTGANAGSVQTVTAYTGTSGDFTVADVFPSPIGFPTSIGDTFALVPRTADNVEKLLNDVNTTTLSTVGNAEVIGITGDFVQISSKTPGSSGKVFVSGGTANVIAIPIQTVPAGAPVNDFTMNSKAGLSKGLYVKLTVDAAVTTGDGSVPYNNFIATSLISALPAYYTGMEIEFLSGNNKGFVTTIASYNNLTGNIVLTAAAANAILVGDQFRIGTNVYISNITGTSAPYTITVVNSSNVAYDVSGFIPQLQSAVRDVNGLNFDNSQVEGVDGYKYFTGLIQKTQWTIDGLPRDTATYPGIGAAGTQFEVLSPIINKLKFIISLVTIEGVSLNSVSDSVKNAILEYVNSRGVGQPVVLSEIIAATLSVSGVFDVEILNHTTNIIVGASEIARLDSQDLIVG